MPVVLPLSASGRGNGAGEMKTISIVVLSSLVFFIWISGNSSKAQDENIRYLNSSLYEEISLLLEGGTVFNKQLPYSPIQRSPLSTTAPFQRLAQSCPAGYPVYCGATCCQNGYSCETNCQCLQGKAACSSGCCAADVPHTCAESNRCYATVQDAVDGGCTWASVEVCGVRR